jgi:hypothetical protein
VTIWKRVNRWLTKCLKCLIKDNEAFKNCINKLDSEKYQELSNVINVRIHSKKTATKFKVIAQLDEAIVEVPNTSEKIVQLDEAIVEVPNTSEKKRKTIHLLSQLDNDFCKKIFKKNS